MKLLIIGNGGREHALTWKVAQSPKVSQIFIAPGNPGTALEKKSQNINIAATDIPNLVQFAKKEKIDLTIVGPEAPLALGIVDEFQKVGLAIFGPTKMAAQLESSKAFCKAFLEKNRILTAKYAEFNELNPALSYLNSQAFPLVIKADGLAAGKGVVIAQNKMQAKNAIKNMLNENHFGVAGHRIIIEEFLSGEELSYIVVCDGKNILPLASSQDHKRRDDHDQGPNTGGMGAYSPAKLLTPELEKTILKNIIEPTVKALEKNGTPYLGFLYAGIIVVNNQPYVLEFNCRLGDPETQPLMLRLKSDLVEICEQAIHGKLNLIKSDWDPRIAISVVLASGGYPEAHETGFVISGLTETKDTKIFHAATAIKNNQIISAGGRVLSVCALGSSIKEAQAHAYALAAKISWPNCFYRKDIGNKA